MEKMNNVVTKYLGFTDPVVGEHIKILRFMRFLTLRRFLSDCFGRSLSVNRLKRTCKTCELIELEPTTKDSRLIFHIQKFQKPDCVCFVKVEGGWIDQEYYSDAYGGAKSL